MASLSAYGAQLLGDYRGPQGNTNNEILELLSALYNGRHQTNRKMIGGYQIEKIFASGDVRTGAHG